MTNDFTKTARTNRDKAITSELDTILEEVLSLTGYESKLSLNAKIGGKHANFYDIRHEIIDSAEQLICLYLEGQMNYCDTLPNKETSTVFELVKNMQEHSIVMEYVTKFLERTFLRKYDEYTKAKPNPDEAVIWIGQESAKYGLFISPRFKNGNWENDGSEVRRFKPEYFTIGHILQTGLAVPFEEKIISFPCITSYLDFFRDVLVKSSNSPHEMKIANLYCDYVSSSKAPLSVPLLIPEFRYGGIEKKHIYRLDFTIINPFTLEKYGFELSPWSTHGQSPHIESKTQKEVNDTAKASFDKEMKKHKDFYRKHKVYSFIYTDADLQNIDDVFADITGFLNPEKMHKQLKAHTLDKFHTYK